MRDVLYRKVIGVEARTIDPPIRYVQKIPMTLLCGGVVSTRPAAQGASEGMRYSKSRYEKLKHHHSAIMGSTEFHSFR